MFEDNLSPLAATNFFALSCDCHYIPSQDAGVRIKEKTYLLPHSGVLTQEAIFCSLHMAWNEEGLYFYAGIDSPFKDVFYPAIMRGDSLELFIDTRDIKSSRFTTKFCHHFFFLPQEVESVKAGEITRFRGEETRSLCDPKQLHMQCEILKNGYWMKIFIPAHCLYGYDPEQCNHLGFTYRANRCGAAPQHLSVLTTEFAFEQQPALWASINLVK